MMMVITFFFFITLVFRNPSERKIPDSKKQRLEDLRPLPSSYLVTLLNYIAHSVQD